jgi:hypothetical protein
VNALMSKNPDRVQLNATIGPFVHNVRRGTRLVYTTKHNLVTKYYTYRCSAVHSRIENQNDFRVYEVGLNYEMNTNKINVVYKIAHRDKGTAVYYAYGRSIHKEEEYFFNIHIVSSGAQTRFANLRDAVNAVRTNRTFDRNILCAYSEIYTYFPDLQNIAGVNYAGLPLQCTNLRWVPLKGEGATKGYRETDYYHVWKHTVAGNLLRK